MIKQLPGWLNFFILWAAYFVMTCGVNYAINKLRDVRSRAIFKRNFDKIANGWDFGPKKKWHEHIDWLFCFVITAVYCGGYLAKWRFYDGGWHFF